MKSDVDSVGKSFEVFVPEELKGGKGEFFTPRPIVRMAVEMIALDVMKKEKNARSSMWIWRVPNGRNGKNAKRF